MDDLFCEVIGCPHCAAWRRVRGTNAEEYLCRKHQQWLVAVHPDQATDYLPIEELIPSLDEKEAKTPEEVCVKASAGEEAVFGAKTLRFALSGRTHPGDKDP